MLSPSIFFSLSTEKGEKSVRIGERLCCKRAQNVKRARENVVLFGNVFSVDTFAYEACREIFARRRNHRADVCVVEVVETAAYRGDSRVGNTAPFENGEKKIAKERIFRRIGQCRGYCQKLRLEFVGFNDDQRRAAIEYYRFGCHFYFFPPFSAVII